MHHLKRSQFDFFRQFVGLVIIAAVLAMASGCAQPVQVRTFNDYAADVIQTADATVSLARTLLAAKKISSSDAENVAKAAETARDGVKVAREMAVKEGEASGTSRLRLAAGALDDLVKYLNSKKGG